VLHELVARDRYRNYIRKTGQYQLAQEVIAPRPAQRAARPIATGNVASAAGRLFTMLMCAGQGWINLLFHHSDAPCE